jgi:hypothetical protein
LPGRWVARCPQYGYAAVPGTGVVAVTAPGEVPEGVYDRLLWRDARAVLARHQPDGVPTPYRGGARFCAQCGQIYPCWPHRVAREALRLAARPTPPGQVAGRLVPEEVWGCQAARSTSVPFPTRAMRF